VLRAALGRSSRGASWPLTNAHYHHSLDFVQLALPRKEFGAAVVVSDPIRRLAIDLRKEAYDCKSAALSMRGSSGRCIADRLAYLELVRHR
jgi:hypothetical protein